MEQRLRVLIKVMLDRALNNGSKFMSKWAVFEFLEKKLRADTIHENALEIEEIWKELLSSNPLTPPSMSSDVHPQEPEVDQAQGDDQISETISVPPFDQNVEPTVVSIFLPNTAKYSHANTKKCKGEPSYINIKTVRENQLEREDDGTVIVMWKNQRHQQVADQTARRTRCIVLKGENAEDMQVDMLFGSGYEAGVRHAAPSPPLLKEVGVAQPPTVQSIRNNICYEKTSFSNNKPSFIMSFPQGLPDEWIQHPPDFILSNGTTGTNTSPAARKVSANSSPSPNRRGKRKAEDEAETQANAKRSQTAHDLYAD